MVTGIVWNDQDRFLFGLITEQLKVLQWGTLPFTMVVHIKMEVNSNASMIYNVIVMIVFAVSMELWKCV